MNEYNFKALNNDNKIVKGKIIAQNEKEARAKIKEKGFLPTEILPIAYNQISKTGNSEKSSPTYFLSLNNKIIFTSELETLLRSGISMLEAISFMSQNSPDKSVKKICLLLKQELQNGKTLYQAMLSNFAYTFGEVYLGLVKTGEESGEIENVLSRLTKLLNNQAKLKDKIISSAINPCILILLLIGLCTLFSIKILPPLLKMFTDIGVELPKLAQTLSNICDFTGNYWYILIIGFISIVLGFKFALNFRTFKYNIDNFLLKIPLISNFVTYINLSNFISLLYVSYESGIPIINCVELAKGSISSLLIKQEIESTVKHLKTGKTLAESLELTHTIPRELISMIATGENSGTLGTMLNNASNYIDEKIDNITDKLVKLIDPTILIIFGLIVGFVALAFMQILTSMFTSLF